MLADSCLLISERMRPSRFTCFKVFTGSGLSPFASQSTHSTCWTRMWAARLVNAIAQVRCKGESPCSNPVVKQPPGRTNGARDPTRERKSPVEGFTSRARHCPGGFSPTSEWVLRWPGSRGCPVRLSPSGQGALKAVTDWVRFRNRDDISRRATTSSPKSTGSRTHRDLGRVAFLA